jgi:hypothetical protein
LRRGEQSFFLLPGEELLGQVESIYVLSEEQALLLSAREPFEDGPVGLACLLWVFGVVAGCLMSTFERRECCASLASSG